LKYRGYFAYWGHTFERILNINTRVEERINFTESIE